MRSTSYLSSCVLSGVSCPRSIAAQAGLFSAILTAFLIELCVGTPDFLPIPDHTPSSQKLEPDHAEYSSRALFVIASTLSGTNLTLPEDANPDLFQPKATHRAINALWFTSLTLALIVSMLAILAKQWIGMFVSRMRMPVPDLRYWAHRHRVYRDGLDKWKLTTFVSGLSIFLHVSLLLFLIGLMIYTYELDLVVFLLITTLSGLALTIYTVTTFAPLFDGTCPTATPLLIHGRDTMLWIWNGFQKVEASAAAPFTENRVVSKDVNNANVDIVAWIINNLRGEQEVDVALDAMAALPKGRTHDTPDAGANGATTQPRSGTVPGQPSVEAHEGDPLLSRLNQTMAGQRLAEIEISRARASMTNNDPTSPTADVHLKNLLSSRLHRLVSGRRHAELEENAGELARVIRSTMRFVVRVTDLSNVRDLERLLKVRTHDVAVLSAMLLDHQDFIEGALSFKLPVGLFGRAFGAWTLQPTRQRTVPPITTHTSDILLDYLARYRLSANLYGALVLTFGHDPDQAQRWIALANDSLRQDLDAGAYADVQVRWDSLSVSCEMGSLGYYDGSPTSAGAIDHAVWGWSKMFMGISNAQEKSENGWIQQQHHRAVQCFALALGLSRGDISTSSVTIVLRPFQNTETCMPIFFPALSAALKLVRGNLLTTKFDWDSSFDCILFGILSRSRHHQSIPHGFRDDIITILEHLMHHNSPEISHEYLIGLVKTTGLIAPVRNTIRVLFYFTGKGDQSQSIWSVAMVCCAGDAAFFPKFASLAATLTARLALFAAFDPKHTAIWYKHLLGNGNGTRFILAAKTRNEALDIARHTAAYAQEEWTLMCAEIRAGKWRSDEWVDPVAPAAAVNRFIGEAEAEAKKARVEYSEAAETLRQVMAESAAAR